MVKISPDELSHPQSRAHATDVRFESKADILGVCAMSALQPEADIAQLSSAQPRRGRERSVCNCAKKSFTFNRPRYAGL
jgi:hypothetical protein